MMRDEEKKTPSWIEQLRTVEVETETRLGQQEKRLRELAERINRAIELDRRGK